MSATRRLIACCFCLLGQLCGCSERAASPAAPTIVNPSRPRAFFFWKQRLDASTVQPELLERLHVTRLYVRLFDLTWDRGRRQVVATPPVRLGKLARLSVEIVPTVFVTQPVLEKLAPRDLTRLAEDLLRRARRVLGAGRWSVVQQMLIDCDWSPSTRERYFELLRLVRKRLGAGRHLSATLRLHQLRDRQRNGIPPVSRVMLMFYNVRPPARFGRKNALVDHALIAGYLNHQSPYPLPVDIALGIFSWAAHFNADHDFLRLIRDVTSARLHADPTHFESVGSGLLFRVREKTYLGAAKLLPGDLLRVDEQRPDAQLELARMLAAKRARFAKNRRFTTALYHLDPAVIAGFCGARKHCLSRLFSAFALAFASRPYL